ncbi:thioredoxin [Nitzschia inconspicua]|uniref:Thioredoxin n=1 Tax=Nitzschia inconspicua TaxID=303405 RepID=A0A9K3Q444_9STRA|nr:thioredoxin [Nitzschia inconspicua]
MRSVHFQAFVLAMCLSMAVGTGTPSPTCNTIASATTTTTGTCAAAKNTSNNNCQLFGVPDAKLAKAAASTTTTTTKVMNELRGGELHEPETLQETEDLVLTAATNRQLMVIDFTASWCGPCKAIAPLYKELSEEFDGEVVFCKVDVDENPDTAAKYSVSAMPTFVFISGGVVVDRLMGANPAKLRELIEEHM